MIIINLCSNCNKHYEVSKDYLIDIFRNEYNRLNKDMATTYSSPCCYCGSYSNIEIDLLASFIKITNTKKEEKDLKQEDLFIKDKKEKYPKKRRRKK